jgi:hypothetical protein
MLRHLIGSSSLAILMLAAPAAVVPDSSAHAQIGIGVSLDIGFHVALAPPALPVYVQPPLPAIGYIWVPGYWHWSDFGYYWVPGTWVEPPAVGLLWTPGYWGYQGGYYGFHAGYWGPHVGFYGGINYGFGYTGTGFYGGNWRGGVFAYNQTYNNFGGVHVTNVYNQTVVVNRQTNVSYNGPGGITAQPTPQERSYASEPHRPPTAMQVQHVQLARANPALRQSVNHGAPAIAATQRPAEFKGPGVVQARAAGFGLHPAAAGPVHPAVERVAARPDVVRPSMPVHPNYASVHRAAAAPHQPVAFHSEAHGAPRPAAAPARPAAPRAAGHGSEGKHH